MLRRMLLLLLTFGLSCTFLHLGLPSDAEAQPMVKRKRPKKKKRKLAKKKPECPTGRDRAKCKKVKTKTKHQGRCMCGVKYRQCFKRLLGKKKITKRTTKKDVDSFFVGEANPCEQKFKRCMTRVDNPRIESVCVRNCRSITRDTLAEVRQLCTRRYKRARKKYPSLAAEARRACITRQQLLLRNHCRPNA